MAITRTFQRLVKACSRVQKRPSDYADRLNLTTSYLNDTVRAVTGFPATQLIQQEVFGGSVKEISFQPGDDDNQ